MTVLHCYDCGRETKRRIRTSDWSHGLHQYFYRICIPCRAYWLKHYAWKNENWEDLGGGQARLSETEWEARRWMWDDEANNSR